MYSTDVVKNEFYTTATRSGLEASEVAVLKNPYRRRLIYEDSRKMKLCALSLGKNQENRESSLIHYQQARKNLLRTVFLIVVFIDCLTMLC